MLLARRQVERPPPIIVLRVGVDRSIVQEVFNRPYVARGCGRDDLRAVIDAGACVEIKILRAFESSRGPPRHRRDACSIAWRCRILTARPSQDGRVIAEK